MAAISEALGIAHHDCGKGSNVEGPFLVAIADALGLGTQAIGSIEQNIDLLVGTLTSKKGSDYHSTEGTITNRALRVIFDGIVEGGHAVVPLDHGAPAARIAMALAAEEGGVTAEEAAIAALDLSDERKRSLRSVVVREGQSSFRRSLMHAYGGSCAITGVSIEPALEAAHIRPYKGPRTNQTNNGILLRADLHRMWDVGLLAVHEDDLSVLVAAHVSDPSYAALRGRQIRIPTVPSKRPLTEALRQQREWARL